MTNSTFYSKRKNAIPIRSHEKDNQCNLCPNRCNHFKKVILILLAFVAGINLTQAQWQRTNGPYSASPITCIAVSGTNMFAGTGANGVFLSTDSGTTWTAVNNGLTDTTIVSLAVIGTNIFAGTGSGGGIFLSTDTGLNWSNPFNGSYISCIAASGTIILGATLGGGILLSTDTGATWTSRSTFPGQVVSFAICGANIFAGLNAFGGRVFLSTDTGASWTLSNVFSKPITSFAVSGTNIFAGTSGGVFLSSDTGTTWTAVNNGLTDSTITSLAVSGTNIFAGTDTAGVWKNALSGVITTAKEIPFNKDFSIYPNPAKNQLTVVIANPVSAGKQSIALDIYNVIGEKVLSSSLSFGEGRGEAVDISSLPSGVYFLEMKTEYGVSTQRFVKE